MPWLEPRSRILLFAAAVCLVGIGVVVVRQHAPLGPTGGTVAWTGTGGISFAGQGTNATAPYPTAEATPRQGGVSGVTLPRPSAVAPSADTPDTFDASAFLALLTGGATHQASAGGSAPQESSEVYAYIPTGLISTGTPSATRSASQQALFEYGNAAGSFILAFETQYPDMARILTDQAQDRTDAAKAAALTRLADDLSGLGRSLLGMDDVPTPVAAANTTLGTRYEMLGQKLALVAKASSDADFVAAIQSYDASADEFVSAYVALAQLLGAYGVQFSSEDPGRVFTFSQNGL